MQSELQGVFLKPFWAGIDPLGLPGLGRKLWYSGEGLHCLCPLPYPLPSSLHPLSVLFPKPPSSRSLTHGWCWRSTTQPSTQHWGSPSTGSNPVLLALLPWMSQMCLGVTYVWAPYITLNFQGQFITSLVTILHHSIVTNSSHHMWKMPLTSHFSYQLLYTYIFSQFPSVLRHYFKVSFFKSCTSEKY